MLLSAVVSETIVWVSSFLKDKSLSAKNTKESDHAKIRVDAQPIQASEQQQFTYCSHGIEPRPRNGSLFTFMCVILLETKEQ